MSSEPTPKQPRKKDAEYMRKAYLYSAILFILGLIGAFLLADRILVAEGERGAAPAEVEEGPEESELPR